MNLIWFKESAAAEQDAARHSRTAMPDIPGAGRCEANRLEGNMKPDVAAWGRTVMIGALWSLAAPAGAYLIQVDCLGSGGNPGSASSTLTNLSCDSGGVIPLSTGRAEADLSQQSLRAFASGATAYGSSYFNEFVTLSGGPASGTTRVELTMRLEGAFGGAGSSTQALLGSLAVASGPTARADYWYSGSGYTIDGQTYSVANNGSYAVTDLSTGYGDIVTDLSVAFDVDLAAPTFQLFANLVAWAWDPSMVVDFENTARLSIRLSDGLLARTDSGHVIPATPTGAVPEPPGLGLVSLALLALAAPRLRRRQAVARPAG